MGDAAKCAACTKTGVADMTAHRSGAGQMGFLPSRMVASDRLLSMSGSA